MNIDQQNSNDFIQYYQGYSEGVRSAKGNTKWMISGFTFGIFGAAGAYTIPPDIKDEYMDGKSAAYRRGYNEGYISFSRRMNTIHAIRGWSIWIPIYIIVNAYINR